MALNTCCLSVREELNVKSGEKVGATATCTTVILFFFRHKKQNDFQRHRVWPMSRREKVEYTDTQPVSAKLVHVFERRSATSMRCPEPTASHSTTTTKQHKLKVKFKLMIRSKKGNNANAAFSLRSAPYPQQQMLELPRLPSWRGNLEQRDRRRLPFPAGLPRN